MKQSTDAVYQAISNFRNHIIVISLILIIFLLIISYFILARLVAGPIMELAIKAGELSQGNLSVFVPVHANDVIGILARCFNTMVKSTKDQIEYANSFREGLTDPLIIVDTGGRLLQRVTAFFPFYHHTGKRSFSTDGVKKIFSSN